MGNYDFNRARIGEFESASSTIDIMNYYGAKDLAAGFRTVRDNTIKIAEEIGEEHYTFRAAPETRSIAETLVHIARVPNLAFEIHAIQKRDTLVGFDFMALIVPMVADESVARSKAGILQLLTGGRDQFGAWLEGLSEDVLSQSVAMHPGMQPASKSRFEMLLGVKEHEMHHRGQLMVLQRMVGMVPHLTRQMQAMMQQMQAGAAR
jgi:uncharacterized damage-inducible protein DinB